MTHSSRIAPLKTPNNNDDNDDALQTLSEHILMPPPRRMGWVSPMELVQSDKSSEYVLFKLNQHVSKYALALGVIQSFFIVYRALCSLLAEGIPSPIRVIAMLRLIVPVCVWLYFYLSSRYVPSNVLTAEGSRIIVLGNVILLLQTIFTGGMFLSWVATRDFCEHDLCLQDFPKKMLPLSFFTNIVVTSIGNPLFVTCHDVSACLLSVVITIIVLLSSTFLLHLDIIDSFAVGVMCAGIIFILFSYEGNVWIGYRSFSKFESVLRVHMANENNEYLLKTQTKEMRHMIGMNKISLINSFT